MVLALHTLTVHLHAWRQRTVAVIFRQQASVEEMVSLRSRRILRGWQRTARRRKMTNVRGARLAAAIRKQRLEFGVRGWLQASEILRTRVALELGTLERCLGAWHGVARCKVTVSIKIDESCI